MMSASGYLRQYIPNHHKGIMALSLLLLFSSAISLIQWPVYLMAIVGYGSVVSWLLWVRTKEIAFAITAQLHVLIAPMILGWYVLSPRLAPECVS